MTTSNLVNRISINNTRTNCEIEIRLNDKCRNGHEDFAMTANFWTPGNPRIDQYCEVGGCCHEEILKVRPDLKIFADLHLCDFSGAPMYAIENGFYHLKEQRKNADWFCDYFSCNQIEYDILHGAEDKRHFAYLVQKLEIPKVWAAKAAEATAKLEKMIGTGEKFESKATRRHFTPLTPEEMEEMENLIAEGYYEPEAIKQRQDAAKAAKIAKLLEEKEISYQKKLREIETEHKIEIALIKTFGSRNNWIYYTHSNQLRFNWLDYGYKFSPEEIERARLIISEIDSAIEVYQ